MSSSAHRWILIGPIGSGKSTVGRLLRQHGIKVIDADRIGHEILEPGGLAYESVARRWPEVVHEGRIDRRQLGRIVFSDPEQLHELELMTHPHIRDRVIELDESSGGSTLVLELPVLNDLVPEEWSVILVDAPTEVREARLLDRGMTAEEVTDRMAAQPPQGAWIEQADLVIDNSGSLTDTETEVEALLPILRAGLPRDDPEQRKCSDSPEQIHRFGGYGGAER